MNSMKYLIPLFFALLLFASPTAAEDFKIWSGGVGTDERAAAPNGALKIILSQSNGKYITDCEVAIHDENGETVLKTMAEGPWVIIDLPAGNYSVVARRSNGDIQSTRFSVDEVTPTVVGLIFPME